jgi:tetratricopeptide (TPR) repeat protein
MSRRLSNRGDSLRAAEKFYAEGEYEKAVEVLESIPEEPEVLKVKAQNLRMMGQVGKAIECYKKIVKSRPGDLSSLMELAVFLASEGRYKAAVKIYDRAIRLDPQVAAIHRDRALALRLDDDSESALEGYDAALRLDGGDGETWAAKADLLIELHRFSEAMECLEKASAAPSRGLNAIGWSSRGSSFDREEALDEALRCYDRAIEQDPKEVSAILGKATVLQQKGDLDGALTHCNRMIEIQPDDARGWVQKGSVLMAERRFRDALECFQVAVKIDSDDEYLWYSSGYCRQQIEQYGDSVIDFDKAIALNPGYSPPWENKGLSLYRLGRPGEAMSAWRRALDLDPDLMWPSNNIGWVLAEEYNNPEEALQWYDRAIDLGTNEATPATNKARALMALKRDPEARSLLEETLERVRAEQKSDVLCQLAELFSERLKDAQKALELYERAAALGVTDSALTLNVAEQLIRLGRHEEGSVRASSVLQEEVIPPLRTFAALLLYVSHALRGDLEGAHSCFSEFLDRLIESRNPSASKPQTTTSLDNYSYDGLIDAIIDSSGSLATKFELLVAIDLQAGKLVAPSPPKVRELASLIPPPTAPPSVAVPKNG